MTAYMTEVWRLRHFWMALVRNDLRNRYRRSVLGLGWSLLQPIAMTVVLCTVFAGVFGMSLSEYTPYLLSGLTFWGFISTAALTGCQSFSQGESYIRQHRAPLAIYPLRTTLGAGYHFLVGMGVVLVAVGIFSGFKNPLVLLSLVPSLVLLVHLRLVAGRVHGHAQCALPRHATPAGDHPADLVLRNADHLQARRSSSNGTWDGPCSSIRLPYCWNWFASRFWKRPCHRSRRSGQVC